jgi:hypothetical protein
VEEVTMSRFLNRYALGGASVILVALSLSAPLGAAPVVTKKQIKIDSRTRGIDAGTGKFVLQLGTGGDLGTVTFTRSFRPGGDKEFTAPDGQHYFIATETDTLKGRNGTLVIDAVGPAYQLGGGFGNYENWNGKWSIVSGTGDYSGLRGGGRYFGMAIQTPVPPVIKTSTGFVQP